MYYTCRFDDGNEIGINLGLLWGLRRIYTGTLDNGYVRVGTEARMVNVIGLAMWF